MRKKIKQKYMPSTLYTTTGINNRCHLIWHTSIQAVKQLFRQRVPDFRGDFYQSGSCRIGATGVSAEFFRRYRSIVAGDTSGAHWSRSCSRVSFRLRLIVCQMCHRSRLVSFSGLPDLRRLSTAFCSPLKGVFNGRPRAACRPATGLTVEILQND